MLSDNDDDDEARRPGMRTRRTNKQAHPGVRAMELLAVGLPEKAKRRSSSEVQAENAAKAKAKELAEAEAEEHIAKIARLETQIEEDDEMASGLVST